MDGWMTDGWFIRIKSKSRLASHGDENSGNFAILRVYSARLCDVGPARGRFHAILALFA